MIVCKDLQYLYPKSQSGLLNFSFQNDVIRAGSIYGLLGKNGAGKTTLMHILIGALKPQKGECLIHGKPIHSRAVDVLQDTVIVPETFELPPVTPEIYHKSNAPFYPAFDSHLYHELMRALNCPHDKALPALSMGQQKKFLFAFTVATRAKLLILDEPTNGLDIPSKILFKQIIRKNISNTQSVIISTHQIKDVEGIIDSIIIIENGEYLMHSAIDAINTLFTLEKRREVPADALFSMPDGEGYTVLKKRIARHKLQSRDSIDLEMFFTMAVQMPDMISGLMTSGNSDGGAAIRALDASSKTTGVKRAGIQKTVAQSANKKNAGKMSGKPTRTSASKTAGGMIETTSRKGIKKLS